MRAIRLTAISIAIAYACALAPVSAFAAPDTTAPVTTQKLVFVHHSTGQAWLQDGYGDLGIALRDANYFVSDTHYGWGPDSIGDNTDVGHWWTWFRGPSASSYTSALFAQSGQNSSYSRRTTDPGGSNTVVMFKSCFPNSNVDGSPSDTVPTIAHNPLKGTNSPLTVGNAKGIYLDLLEYFKTKPDTMFVLIVSPPLRSADTNSTSAANARYLANWLVSPTGWLKDYTTGNVVAWDYYTVLTGGHHRITGGVVEHTPGASNYLAFPTSDSHPSATGDVAATAEFVPFLNAAYNSWKNGTGANLAPIPQRTATLTKPWPGQLRLSHAKTYRWRGTVSPPQIGAGSVTLEIQHLSRGHWSTWIRRRVTLANGSSGWNVWLKLRHSGSYRARVRHGDADHRSAASAYRRLEVR